MMQGYKTWCPATTIASTLVETNDKCLNNAGNYVKKYCMVHALTGNINGLEINSCFFFSIAHQNLLSG
jgi:hypothetical protein